MRLIYVNNSKVTKLEQKMNNSESFLPLLKNLLKCTYEVFLPSQRYDCDYSRIGIWGTLWGSQPGDMNQAVQPMKMATRHKISD